MLFFKAFDSKMLNIVTSVFFVVYFLSMFIIPLYTTGLDWSKYQRVLYSWQSLNVGVLAFLASVVALSITKYNEEKQREREFTAAKALLPTALSNLCNYLEKCSKVYIANLDVLDYKKRVDSEYTPMGGYSPGPTVPANPELKEDFIIIFKDCIRHSSPEIGKYLADILKRLQVHQSRVECKTKGNDRYILGCIYEMAAIQSKVSLLFDFARNEKSFDKIKPMDLASLNNSYNVLDINLDTDKRRKLNEITKKNLQ